MAFNSKEAYFIARKFGHEYRRKFIVKAQIQASGRVEGFFRNSDFKGGIHLVNTPEEVADVAKNMCGKILVCPESGD